MATFGPSGPAGGIINPSVVGSTLQSRQMAQIRLKQRAEFERLKFEREQFATLQANRNQILAMFKDAFGEGSSAFSIPTALREKLGLFMPGGEFGENTLAIERGGQKAIAAGQVGLAQTGMSSGTNVAGLRARVIADTALAHQGVESRRAEGYGNTLSEIGSSQLSLQQLGSQERQAFLSSLASFR